MRLISLIVCLCLWPISAAQALVFVAQPQESVETGEKVFQPIAELLSEKTGQPWTYQHPDNQLNYVDYLVEDRAELYLGDPHFVGYQLEVNSQRLLAQVPDQDWVLVAPQSSTGKLLGANVTSSFSCTEAPTCALPPPDLGMLLFSNLEVFANNPLRHPMLVSVEDAAEVVEGVLGERCYCGVTRRALLENLSEADRGQLAIRSLQTTLGAAFTVSDRVSPALADQIQAALLSPEGAEATRAMRERLYGGAELIEPSDTGRYLSSSNLLIEEYLIPMNRMPKPGDKNTETVDVVAADNSQSAAPASASQSSGGDGNLTLVSWGGAYSA
ncbi:MAG TPA: PhnD/SsuA/transferrin family substrate-binding protein, partial [Arenicellales bacterium]|nr:PhnD/SsuA/transferrin family substrate-binding protein [Arenicellales bacterium]